MQEPGFLKPHERILIHENRLPHWQQDDCTYFLSFRLADSLPQTLLDTWHTERANWLSRHPEPRSAELQREYRDLFPRRRETWLDAGHGECALKNPRVREAAEKSIRSHAQDTVLWSLVLMPNHVHALVSMTDHREGALGKLLKNWKGASARAANTARLRQGTFWAKDYFDRLIRDAGHFLHCARYIRRNPEKARLPAEDHTLWEHPYVRTLLDT